MLDIFLSLKIKQIQQEEESQLTAAEMRKRNSALSKTERKVWLFNRTVINMSIAISHY